MTMTTTTTTKLKDTTIHFHSDLGRSSEHATLVYGLFWVKDTWEAADARKDMLALLFIPENRS